MKNAVIYTRVSSISQEENTSLEMQEEKARSYAATYDYNLVKVFSDVSSGKNTNREGYQSMKQFVNEHDDIDGIIVYKLDRLHRHLKTLLNDEEQLSDHGVSIVSVSEMIDTSTSTGKMFFQIIGSFAEFEGNRISERVLEGKSQKIEKGMFTAGKIPYGYRIDKSEILEIVPEEAENVKRIFELKAKENLSFRKIAVEVFHDEKKYGMVGYVLKNTAYIGKLRQEKGKIVTIPRIISTQLFNKANPMKKGE